MGDERNQANQKNKIKEILSYQKRTKNQRYNNWRYLETLRNRRRKTRNKEIGERKNLMKDSKVN